MWKHNGATLIAFGVDIDGISQSFSYVASSATNLNTNQVVISFSRYYKCTSVVPIFLYGYVTQSGSGQITNMVSSGNTPGSEISAIRIA